MAMETSAVSSMIYLWNIDHVHSYVINYQGGYKAGAPLCKGFIIPIQAR